MRSIVLGLVLSIATVVTSSAQSLSILYTLIDPTPDNESDLGGQDGHGLAAVGNDIVIGETFDLNDEGEDVGAIHVFDGDTGRIRHVLNAPFAREDDYLGAELTVLNGLVVGPVQPRNIVYLFDPFTGEVVQRITAPVGAVGFAAAVAPAGANLLVGAANTFINGVPAGAVYRMNPTTGGLLQTYLNPNGGEYDWFGTTVRAAGNDVLATAVGDDTAGPQNGAVYLLDGATGAMKHKFLPPTSDPGSTQFGRHLLVLGQTLFVSERAENALAPKAGAVHLFDLTTGALLKTLTSPQPEEQGYFGTAMTTMDGLVYISAPQERTATGSGAIHLFDAAGTYRSTITSSRFAYAWGLALASTGSRLIVASVGGPIGNYYGPAVDVLEFCGNGSVAGIEQCDDGNDESGDGCSATCQIEKCGPTPASGCLSATSGGLELDDDRVKWSWRGQGALPADLGDPTTTSSYVLCAWDTTVAPQPRMALAAPAGRMCSGKPCWKALGTTGFRYQDREGAPNGMFKMILKASNAGKVKLSLQARGSHLTVPTIFSSHTTRVQLHSTTSAVCWESGLAN